MRQRYLALGILGLLTLGGCRPADDGGPAGPPTPGAAGPADAPAYPAPATPTRAELSWDTDRDRAFADFLREQSGGMVARAAVGLEKAGMLRVDLDRSMEPEAALPMASKLADRARRDFPDRPTTLAIFDPGRRPILKARWRPGQGVRFQFLPEKPAPPASTDADGPPPAPRKAGSGAIVGLTEVDRAFADRAGRIGRTYLRYLEVDLDRHGRIWLAANGPVTPGDLPDLTRPLLDAARESFPGRELRVTVLGADGMPIGSAVLSPGGEGRWKPADSDPPR